MGLCRGLNLLLGVAAAPAVLQSAWLLAAFPVTYIAAVTALSRGEVHGGRRGIAAFALISLGLVLIGLVALWAANGATSWPGLALILILGWRVLPPFWAARQSPDPMTIRRAIRTGVLSLALAGRGDRRRSTAAAFTPSSYSRRRSRPGRSPGSFP